MYWKSLFTTALFLEAQRAEQNTIVTIGVPTIEVELTIGVPTIVPESQSCDAP
jgi:hypothetical protein